MLVKPKEPMNPYFKGSRVNPYFGKKKKKQEDDLFSKILRKEMEKNK